MSQHSTSHITSTLTHSAIVTSHGKISAVSYSEAMEVDQDGQRLADRKDDKDNMDTTLEGAQKDAHQSNAPEEPVARIEIPVAEVLTRVLDRPREGDGEAQQSSTHMRKTPH